MDAPLEWKDNVSHPVLEMTSCSFFSSQVALEKPSAREAIGK